MPTILQIFSVWYEYVPFSDEDPRWHVEICNETFSNRLEKDILCVFLPDIGSVAIKMNYLRMLPAQESEAGNLTASDLSGIFSIVFSIIRL